jgi:radical SAM protein with 4Fe4S-binding SPASM domain
MRSAVNFADRSLPKSFVFELTRRCNNHCLYCYLSEKTTGQDSDPNRNRELSTAEVINILAKLHDETQMETVALSGGETLLREDLPEILSFLRTKNISPVIITNGTLLTPEKIAATMDDVTYEVTLLSYKKDVHDRMAGHRGAWEAVVDGLSNLRKAGGHFVIVFVATRLNWGDLRKTAELAIAMGAEALMYNRINIGKFNLQHADQLLPSHTMIRENLDALEEMAEKYGLPVAVSVVIEPCVVDVRKYRHIHFGWCPLAGGDSYFTIDPLGFIRVCNHSAVVLGNLREESFKDIYYNHPYLRSFRETWPAECDSCEPELKEMCCGGCKAAAEQCYGDLKRVDPFVTLSPSV